MRQTPAERTIDAECRAVEAGHQARLDREGRAFLVKGEDHPDNTYRVRVVAGPEVVVWTCDHPVVLGHADQPQRTYVPCRHGATAARRLEREGLLRWAGDRWLATDKAAALAPPQPDDPFEGLPK